MPKINLQQRRLEVAIEGYVSGAGLDGWRFCHDRTGRTLFGSPLLTGHLEWKVGVSQSRHAVPDELTRLGFCNPHISIRFAFAESGSSNFRNAILKIEDSDTQAFRTVDGPWAASVAEKVVRRIAQYLPSEAKQAALKELHDPWNRHAEQLRMPPRWKFLS